MNPEEIRHLISNSSEPLIFRKVLQWDISNWSLSNWKDYLGKELMGFRMGNYRMTLYPQWERHTSIKTFTFEQFLEQIDVETNKWFYFDYKYLNSNLENVPKVRENMSWNSLGFPEINSEDCTIWIGSKGAHTPCHIDSYGFNLIHQIYGRKLWVLFPPEENLKPTRIPYEESSIYSRLNFFSPSLEAFKGISNCHMVILEPGDVLYLPKHWWHYVENLDIAITVNVWIPLPDDTEERVKEALVQLFVKQVCDVSNEDTNKLILNPNMDEILNVELSKTYDIFKECKSIYQRQLEASRKKTKLEKQPECERSKFDLNSIIQKNCVLKIPKLSNSEFFDFLKKQHDRFTQGLMEATENKQNIQQDQIDLLKVLTDSDVINLIKDKIIKR